MDVQPASVLITATIHVPANSTADAVTSALGDTLDSAAHASDALGITVEATPTITVVDGSSNATSVTPLPSTTPLPAATPKPSATPGATATPRPSSKPNQPSATAGPAATAPPSTTAAPQPTPSAVPSTTTRPTASVTPTSLPTPQPTPIPTCQASDVTLRIKVSGLVSDYRDNTSSIRAKVASAGDVNLTDVCLLLETGSLVLNHFRSQPLTPIHTAPAPNADETMLPVDFLLASATQEKEGADWRKLATDLIKEQRMTGSSQRDESAGSVVLDMQVTAPFPITPAEVEEALEASLGTKDKATAVLGLPVETDPVIFLTPSPPPSGPPPPPQVN